MTSPDIFDRLGSSPRVRSRRTRIPKGLDLLGIISACAEQTLIGYANGGLLRDHLRVCGADRKPYDYLSRRWGSSPRVRSRPADSAGRHRVPGIISACAEQTCRLSRLWLSPGDHLRVCGADNPVCRPTSYAMGSSPRVRSRLP